MSTLIPLIRNLNLLLQDAVHATASFLDISSDAASEHKVRVALDEYLRLFFENCRFSK